MLRLFSRRRAADSRIWMLLAVIGPGIITANADNDATGILGYSLAGAAYQYRLLWVQLLTLVVLCIAQEACARMGAVTGKGLADLIREEFGVRITLIAMLVLLVANFATTVAEFAGMLAAVQVFTGPEVRFVVIPVVAVAIWLLVVRGSYRRVERLLLWASFIYLSYIVAAFLSRPDWGKVLHDTFLPHLGDLHELRPDLAARHISPVRDYVFMVVNVVGTTITPWGQFYIQSSVRDKGVRAEEYGYTKIDVLFGSFFTSIVAFCIIVCCGSVLFRAGIHDLSDAGDAARALQPFAGSFASLLFAVGLFNASCFGAIIVPLSTAYAVTEALGWESSLGRRTREAPLFIGVFTLLVASAALIVLIFPHKLTWLIILPNIVGGVLLPVILVLMQRLVTRRRLLGDYVNTPGYNRVAWASTAVVTLLSLLVLATQFL